MSPHPDSNAPAIRAAAAAAQVERRVDTEADIAEGLDHLVRLESRFAHARTHAGAPPLRRRPGGFSGLFQIVAQQQVSVASGRAIWARVVGAGGHEAGRAAALGEEGLRELGLSRPKARTGLAIAAALDEGRLCFRRQSSEPTERAMAELTAIKGVGPWTAGVYHLACEGRADLWPVGDVALHEAMRSLFALETRPSAAEAAAMAEAWSPWRAVAARMLWSWRRHETGRAAEP